MSKKLGSYVFSPKETFEAHLEKLIKLEKVVTKSYSYNPWVWVFNFFLKYDPKYEEQNVAGSEFGGKNFIYVIIWSGKLYMLQMHKDEVGNPLK